MRLPGQLSATTLGDLLGSLARAGATGRLSLIDKKGLQHSIVIREGKVHEVDTPLGPRLGDVLDGADQFSYDAAQAEIRLGEYLLRAGQVSEARLHTALRQLNLLKLEQLFGLSEASIRFHIARPQSQDEANPKALEQDEFLHDRPRKRGGQVSRRKLPTRGEALQVLGLPSDASPSEVKQAFRILAQRCHPDRHPQASPLEKAQLIVQFSQISHAYHALVR